MPEARAAAILRECGLKHTAGREAVLQILLDAGKPLSHKEICKKLGALSYDPVSVYRSLESFVLSPMKSAPFSNDYEKRMNPRMR